MEDLNPEASEEATTAGATPKWVWLAVAALTLIGAILRIKADGASMLGDELSTVWIVKGNSLGEVFSRVYSDAEISPPLYFVLAWMASKLGSDPVLIRLPAMIAGIISIPLAYAVGVRMIGRFGALVATAIVTFSPFFVFYSATGRAYSLGLMMLLLSTLTLLVAIQDGRNRWWVLYAVASALTLYSHYTMAFALVGQFLWVLFAHPAARRPAFFANLGAAALFLPWIPGFIADNSSITTPITEALQGHGFHDKLVGVEQLVFFQVNIWNWNLSGRIDVLLISIGSLGAAAGALYRRFVMKARWVLPGSIDRGLLLALTLSLSTAIGELILLAAGSNVFGARNLAATWEGLPFLLGGLIALNGPVLGGVFASILLVGLGIGAVRTTDASKTAFDYKAVAAYLDSGAKRQGAVVDAANFTPAPTTSLSLYLPPERQRYDVGVSPDKPDFIKSIFLKEDPQLAVSRAFEGEGPVQVVTLIDPEWVTDRSFYLQRNTSDPLVVPPGWQVTSQKVFPGIQDLIVSTYERTGKTP